MPYLILTVIPPEKTGLKQQLRPDHIEYLDGQVAIILAAGAKLQGEASKGGGSFYLVDYEEAGDAKRFIENDPYVKGAAVTEIEMMRVRKGYFGGARADSPK
jgi:hypothetical protein